VHLTAHVATRKVITPEQITKYDAMRGYDGPGAQPHQHQR
jgi:hypothetical protein